ncbi:MAG: SRPBCC family protein [Tannerella sp.]|jgi:hypothetical protein|nr:SRPBCC family protein [Tannerella sp.]
MKILIYILIGIVFIILIILIIGLFLPKTKTLIKQTVYNASAEKVYNTVTNNRDWKYRTSLNDLKIIETNGDIETWDETSEGNTIRFRTKEKRPYSFYSFEMESRFFKGHWFAEFEAIDNENTLFTATESIEYENPFIRVLAHVFMDLDKYMETYQEELRNKLEK